MNTKWQKLVLAELGAVSPGYVPGAGAGGERAALPGPRWAGAVPGAHREASAIRDPRGGQRSASSAAAGARGGNQTKSTVSCSAPFYGTALQH